MLPGGTYVTTRMVADYFEVPESTIKNLTQRHRDELRANGFRILKAVENPEIEKLVTSLSQVSGRGLAIYDRRAVLNVAMLLRDSGVARRVRTYLLGVEEEAVHRPVSDPQPRPYGMPPGRRLGPGPHWDEYEVTSRIPAAEAWRQVIDREVPAPAAPSPSEELDRRLDAVTRVGSALSRKCDDLTDDVRDMRDNLRSLRKEIDRSSNRPRHHDGS